jgi:hypothetical protein
MSAQSFLQLTANQRYPTEDVYAETKQQNQPKLLSYFQDTKVVHWIFKIMRVTGVAIFSFTFEVI